MDSNPYEKSYRAARELLILRGQEVGQPRYREGIRYCPVAGLLLSDRNIFIEAWNEEIADAILDERSIMGDWFPSSDMSSTCTECERLMLAYLFSNETYLEVLYLKFDTGVLSILLSNQLIQALHGKCEIARQELFDHEKSHVAPAIAARSATS